MNRWLAETPVNDQAASWTLVVLGVLLLIVAGFLLASAVLGDEDQSDTSDNLSD